MNGSYADTMREREKSHEAKYKLEEELRFKAEARRNKLLGIWAAERMGMTGAETAAYAKEVVIVDLNESGVGDVVGKVFRDFEKRGVKLTANDIRVELDRLYPIAFKQISTEYPEALDKDHERVGD
ncbi:MAG: hypothetical protein A3G18_03985 [Rhodospirillales bacterium RIFCSPLOWO2_12_FULL_58_28]|nr:MAG: hypothetical protein A3H92_04865 [Rhodospirillales bacterium RIFCSPLOWO2_02_FULL_58_16]OHC78738.1 MAG: hypothetical protein A3G18_03985 [Rhodospirillales bacterium RIFCSPLOWO2_12_FULL_58_28]